MRDHGDMVRHCISLVVRKGKWFQSLLNTRSIPPYSASMSLFRVGRGSWVEKNGVGPLLIFFSLHKISKGINIDPAITVGQKGVSSYDTLPLQGKERRRKVAVGDERTEKKRKNEKTFEIQGRGRVPVSSQEKKMNYLEGELGRAIIKQKSDASISGLQIKNKAE